MKNILLTAALFSFATLSAQANIYTLKTPDGKVATTNEPPHLLAVKDEAAGAGHVLFMFYRTKFKNDQNNSKEHIVYQFAQVSEAGAPLTWSEPKAIDRDDFRSQESVAASVIDGRIYVFGKREGIRYTSATLQEAMNNQWTHLQYLKSSNGERIKVNGHVDVTDYVEQNGQTSLALVGHHTRADAGGNQIVDLYTCRAKSATFSCSEKAQVTGNDLSKQFYATHGPAIAFAPDMIAPFERTLYVIWPSFKVWDDNHETDPKLYFRTTHGEVDVRPTFYGDVKNQGVTRPRNFANANNTSLYSMRQPTALEHKGALEFFTLRSLDTKNVVRYRYEGTESSERVKVKTMPELGIQTTSFVSAVSVNDKLYVAYKNADKKQGGANSVNYVVLD